MRSFSVGARARTARAWLASGAKEIGAALLVGLYPARCAACRAMLEEPGRLAGGFCRSCRESLLVIGPARCPRCGRPREEASGSDRCGPCRAAPPGFDAARAGYEYGAALADAIHRLKYRDTPALAGPLVRVLLEALGDERPAVDRIVPVPLHVRRLRRRGYNQAALLARRLARAWRLPWTVDALARRRDTPPQVQQPSLRARAENVRGAFETVRREAVAGQRILLVDDVMSTGATAGACARALRTSGAASVWVLTLAR